MPQTVLHSGLKQPELGDKVIRFLWVRFVLFSFDFVSHCFFVYDFHPSFGCLADVIFMIYLYQRWKYPVDKKRVNEFGFGGEDDQAADGAEVTAAKEDDKKTN